MGRLEPSDYYLKKKLTIEAQSTRRFLPSPPGGGHLCLRHPGPRGEAGAGRCRRDGQVFLVLSLAYPAGQAVSPW
jgi:hypothetical protein